MTVILFWVSLCGVIIMLCVRAIEVAQSFRVIPQKIITFFDKVLNWLFMFMAAVWTDISFFIKRQVKKVPLFFEQIFMWIWGQFVYLIRKTDRFFRSQSLKHKKGKSSSFFLNSIQEHKEEVQKKPQQIHED